MDRRWSALLVLLVLICTLAAATGCGGSDSVEASTGGDDGAAGAQQASKEGPDSGEDAADGEGDDEPKEEAVPVEVSAIELGPIESVLRFSSNLEAESQVKVFSQAKRQVIELLVEEGHVVRKNQVLVRLQDEEQRSALAKVKSQLDKAEREYERKNRLYTQGMIAEQEYNDATYELDQLRISLDDAKRELGYTEVRAPIRGTITTRMVNLGDQVQIGQELFEIVDFESMVARVFVPEKHLTRLRRGLVARLTSQAVAGETYRCAVERIAPIVDPRSGTVKVTVDVGRQRGLRPGMYVDVELVVATNPSAMLIPKRALVYDNDQMFVFRIGEERRAERLFVEPRLTDKYHVEPAEGFETGDMLVVAGQAGLKDGALVSLPGDDEEEGAEQADLVEEAVAEGADDAGQAAEEEATL